ncbi:Type-4 uracil-DNA glycosylase [Nitrosopumilaceae archaeon]|nr:uracil-DNA glycosylase [Nitrosopumilus sp.]CAI9831426.1 Type-4 uracil-DNA glycosylase [Nitrosopumilaceae archaeon]MDA7940841.1 uracil-DNA glycosylase [Nitrosopumilus sp.]MDA7943303.1 uracil-DNA glycosylase [Nitrosopumilus sp.]MDA7944204.1 uracil-DNA glycosylase [Nitrosopumilus sp.]
MRLGAIAEGVSSCTACGLCETRTRAVPGSGSGGAALVLVGEAPGRSEDLRGEPFVGAAGRILDGALGRAGVARGDVYITNVVKCRPPGNRVPTGAERDACRAHLEAELAEIGPEIICVMGNTALGSLLGESGITKLRGRVARVGGRVFMATVHPAAVIYNPSLAGALDEDIARAARLAAAARGGAEVPVDIVRP